MTQQYDKQGSSNATVQIIEIKYQGSVGVIPRLPLY